MRIIINLFKLAVIAVWMITCFYICNTGESFRYFEYWILCGLPFGLRKMFLVFIPKNLGIAGGIGVLALNAIIGGLIGGVVLIVTVIKTILGMFLKVGSV